MKNTENQKPKTENLLLGLVILCLAALMGCAAPDKTSGVGLRKLAVESNETGFQYYQQGRWLLAKEKFQQALKLNRLIDDRQGIAANLNNLGALAKEQGELAEAAAALQEALELRRLMGEGAGLSETLNNLGTVYQAQGRLAEAETTYREALSWAEALPPGPLLSLSLTRLGDLARERREYHYALSLYARALEIDRAGKNRQGQAVRWERLGRAWLALGNYPGAAAYFRDALEEFRRLEYTGGIVDALEGLTELALAQGDRAGVRLYGERLLKIYQARGQDREAAKLAEMIGRGGQGPGAPAPSPKPSPPIP